MLPGSRSSYHVRSAVCSVLLIPNSGCQRTHETITFGPHHAVEALFTYRGDYIDPFSLVAGTFQPHLERIPRSIRVCPYLKLDYSTQGFLATKDSPVMVYVLLSIVTSGGTNFFVGAELYRLFDTVSGKLADIVNQLVSCRTDWRFNPPPLIHTSLRREMGTCVSEVRQIPSQTHR